MEILKKNWFEILLLFIEKNCSILLSTPQADIFERAQSCAPCVLFIDEIDALFGDRESSGESSRKVCILIKFWKNKIKKIILFSR